MILFLMIILLCDDRDRLIGGETMDVKGLAQKYYPRLWDIDRLKALVAAGKLSEADYEEITGKNYATK